MTEASLLLVAALVSYLVGSISFARVIGRLATPGEDLGSVSLSFHAQGERVEVSGVSATSVSVRAGRRWGFLVALLDIAKAVVVTLVFRWLDPNGSADLVAATFVVVGHVWPVWFRFRGGFGISPILGGLLVIDPVAIPVTIVVSMLIGLLVADRLLVYDGWTLLLAPWFLVVRDDVPAALYALAVTAIYWFAMREEVLDHVRRLRDGPRGWHARFADIRTGYNGHERVG